MRVLLGVAAALLIGGSVLAGPAAATATGTIEPDGPTSAVVRVSGPGYEASWGMGVRNVSGGTTAPVLTIVEATGGIFLGAHPATVELTRGTELLYSGSAEDLVDRSFELGAVTSGGTTRVEATVRLPGDAGDEYRTVSGLVRWEFAALGPDSPSGPTPPTTAPEQPPRIPVTGSGLELPGIANVVVPVLAAGSFLLLLGWQRSRRGPENSASS